MKGPRIFASRFASLTAISAVLAALIGGALADAQAPAPDDAPHLLVVPDTAQGEAAVARTDARIVARYGSFSLVEAAGGDDERLRQAGADRRDDMRTVRTAAGDLDPKRARRSLAGKQAPERDEVLALVQFVGPPKDAWVERLRATGATIVTYQAENAYVVHADGDVVERLAALVGGFAPVRAVSVLTAADKLESRISPTGRYAVQTVAGAAGAGARNEAGALGADVSRPVTVGELHTQYLALSDAEAAGLARDPAVVAIEPYAEPELTDERSAQIVAGNLTAGFAPSGPGYLSWLVNPARVLNESTFDFAIDVTDEGLDNGANPPAHPDFRAQGAGPSRVAYVNNYSSDTGADGGRDCGGHGTNVASIAAGYNSGTSAPALEDGVGFNHGLGVAPFAKVGASKIFNCAGGAATEWTPANLASNAYAASARIGNNSWGSAGQPWGALFGDYTTRAQQYDAVVRDARLGDPGNQQMIEVFAAGNDGDATPGNSNEGYGTILAEGTAKNVITVGAAEGVRASGTDGCGTTDGDSNSARDVVNFSSRGPTDDGRLKPDLVAPSTHVTGARPQFAGFTGYRACTNPFGGLLYTLFSGSSQAAPHVSGAAALVRHWYERTKGADPSPALTKALLINTASDLAGGNNGKGSTIAAGPNSDQGWGRVNVGAALDSTAREFRDQADLLDDSGDEVLRTYRAQDAGKPVKVTLVWTDAPGPTTGDSFVNNLDLEVDAGGRRYLGNVFAGAFSRTGGSADTRNNVESVFLPAGAADHFAVSVKGLQITGDGVPGQGDATDQDFALVVSNADEQPAPVLVHESSSFADSGPGGDGDGVLESGERADFTERVRNAGVATATGLSGTLAGSPGLGVTQSASSYPDLAPGDTAPNDSPYEVELDDGATCGVDVPATLDVDATGPIAESQRVPLVLPTGELGAPASHDAVAPQVPLAIPDDSAAGVASTLFVPDRGRVKDVNVRVSIQHEYVGDLVIHLTSPDGTTVRLAEHPGGPDNNGRDLTGTVFNDEASLPLGAAGTSAPYTGDFKPQSDQLSRFDGKDRRGTWTLRVRDSFEDDIGTLLGWGLTTRKARCDFDVTAPDTALEGVSANPTNDTSPTFGFSSPDADAAGFECQLDGAAYEPCSSPKSYSGLAQGAHTFRVRAVDGSDNGDVSPAEHSWTIDTTPPQTVIDSGPAQGSFTTDTSADFSFSSEPQTRFECSLDGSAFADCSDPQAQAYSSLGEGSHTFRVRAIDLANNADPTPATRTWSVDRTAPSPAVTGPTGSTQDSEPTLTGIGGRAPGDAGSVAVRIYSGAYSAPPPDAPTHTLSASVNAATGRWSVEVPGALALGAHTVEVEQVDAAGNRRSTFSVFSVVTDAVAPVVRLTAPAGGSRTADRTPGIRGTAGTAVGDDGSVVVKLWRGTLAAGLPAQTIVVPRDATSGAFAAVPSTLADGAYTVRAEQGDSAQPAENIGLSNSSVFIVDTSPPPAPSFAVAPREERLAEALGNRYTVLAACAAACRVNANLSVSSRAARRLGLRARSVSLGRSARSLGKAGTAALKVRLTRTARSALRASSGTKATLTVKMFDGGQTLTLRRSVSLQRSVGIARIARRGLGLWAVCSRTCPLRGSLTVSARDARRLAMRPGAATRVTIAAGRANASPAATGLRLKVKRKLRKALRRRARLATRLELTAGSGPANERRALRSFTLRR